MAAFSNFHVVLPGALSRRGIDRISNYFTAAARVAVAVGELGLFLWMALALVFSLVVMAGFFA
jgi:hypothetical protein